MRDDIQQLKSIKDYDYIVKSFCEIGSMDGEDANEASSIYDIEYKDCYIFEGHPRLYKKIKEKFPWINIFNYVVTNQLIDEIEFKCTIPGVTWDEGISSVLDRSRSNWEYTTEVVPAIRIDTFCKNHGIKGFDVVKIDAEGYAWEVLCSFGDCIHKCGFFQVEVEPVDHWKNQKLDIDVIELMKSKDFELIDESKSDIQRELLFKNKLI